MVEFIRMPPYRRFLDRLAQHYRTQDLIADRYSCFDNAEIFVARNRPWRA